MDKLPNVEKVECDLVEGPSCRIVGEEVVKALKLSKTGKAADPSEVMSEIIMTTGDKEVECMTNITCVMTSYQRPVFLSN